MNHSYIRQRGRISHSWVKETRQQMESVRFHLHEVQKQAELIYDWKSDKREGVTRREHRETSWRGGGGGWCSASWSGFWLGWVHTLCENSSSVHLSFVLFSRCILCFENKSLQKRQYAGVKQLGFASWTYHLKICNWASYLTFLSPLL